MQGVHFSGWRQGFQGVQVLQGVHCVAACLLPVADIQL